MPILPSPTYPLVPVGSHADMGMYWLDRWRVEHGILEVRDAMGDIRCMLLWSPFLSESYAVRQRALARAAEKLRQRRKALRVWIQFLVSLP
jgi:hypothetical protein